MLMPLTPDDAALPCFRQPPCHFSFTLIFSLIHAYCRTPLCFSLFFQRYFMPSAITFYAFRRCHLLFIA